MTQRVALVDADDLNTLNWHLRNKNLHNWGASVKDGTAVFIAADNVDLMAEAQESLGPGRAYPVPLAPPSD
jgi:hypothetical protein